jgi:hypothetical protein
MPRSLDNQSIGRGLVYLVRARRVQRHGQADRLPNTTRRPCDRVSRLRARGSVHGSVAGNEIAKAR